MSPEQTHSTELVASSSLSRSYTTPRDAAGTMVSDFWKDPGGRFKEDLLPKLGELLHFTASVLMGTQAVLFPDRTLADFKYLPHPSTPMDGDLFDIDPNDEDEDEEAESSKEGGGEEDEGLEEEWDADEILAARKAFGLIPDTPPNEALKEGLGMLSGHDDSREIFEMERAFGLLPSFPILEKESVAHEQKLPKKMGHPITLPGPIGELAKKIGGVGILANEVGVSTRTLFRWAKVGITSKMGMKLLVQLCNCHQIDPAGLLDHSAKE